MPSTACVWYLLKSYSYLDSQKFYWTRTLPKIYSFLHNHLTCHTGSPSTTACPLCKPVLTNNWISSRLISQQLTHVLLPLTSLTHIAFENTSFPLHLLSYSTLVLRVKAFIQVCLTACVLFISPILAYPITEPFNHDFVTTSYVYCLMLF